LPAGAQGVKWDAATSTGWGHLADGAFAIINLAGETIGGSTPIPLPGTWSDERKKRIKESRLHAGQAVVAAVESAAVKPQVVFQMSGIDYYASSDQIMTEESGRGPQFLADVVADYWEPSTAAVEGLGVRRVVARMAPLLSLETGPLPAFRRVLFRSAWIHAEDAVRTIRFLTDTEAAHGIYNVAAPNPVTNEEFTRILGQVMGRPSILPVPEFALKLLLGEVADFHFPTLKAALLDLLNK